MIKRTLVLISALVLLYSCGYRPNLMIKDDKGYEYATKQDSVVELEHKIRPNDFLNFRLYTNDGFKLVDLTTLNEDVRINANKQETNYLVEHNGLVKLPLIGRVNVEGMTIKEVQKFLEEKYAKFYIDPFVLARVVNRRVVIFNGDAGGAEVVVLQNNNTTLIEGLALAGGLGANGKAKKIKLIRGNPQNPDIYLIDLSTVEGLKQADFILQANDIIYVEPRISLIREVTTDYAPLISVVTSLVTLLIVLNRL